MKLGPYELQGEIGRGGMGRVCRAVHAPTGAVRAVKILAGVADPERVLRFRREAEALARLNGRGVVGVHETGVEGHTLWFAMDLMAGGSLRERLKQGALPWRDAVEIAARIARTLALCHAEGLVHRDLKPDNVLFGDDGEPRLADFGLVHQTTSSLTETGTLMGTPAYMAPEQLEGQAVDGKADVYSLGALLYEMIAGRPASAGRTVLEIHRAASSAKRAPASAFAASPRALDRVLGAALAPRAQDRLAAADLALALEKALEEKDEGRRGLLVGVVGALVLLGALALAWRPGRPDLPDAPAPAPPAPPRVVAKPRAVAPVSTRVYVEIQGALKEKRYGQAARSCEQALEQHPDDEAFRAFAADCLLDAGAVESALVLAASCADRGPGGARALAVRAFVDARRDEPERARDEADRALARDPGLARAWVARSFALSARRGVEGLGEEALAAASRAAALGPPALGAAHEAEFDSYGDDVIDLGIAGPSDWRDGEAVFEHPRFEVRMPPSPAGLSKEIQALSEARHRRANGEWARELEAARRAIDANPLRPLAHGLAGQALYFSGEREAAREELRAGLSLDPWNEELNEGMASFLLAERPPEAALAREHLARAIRVKPSVELYVQLGQACLFSGDDGAEIAALDSAVAMDSRSYALVHRAEARRRRHELQRALADTDEGTSRNPGDAMPFATRARIQLELGNVVAALADCGRALQRNAKNPRAHLVRAVALEVTGDRAQARSELATYRGLGEQDPQADELEERLRNPP